MLAEHCSPHSNDERQSAYDSVDTLFRQVSWPVNADTPSSPMEGISVGKDGILMCAGRTPEECGARTIQTIQSNLQ